MSGRLSRVHEGDGRNLDTSINKLPVMEKGSRDCSHDKYCIRRGCSVYLNVLGRGMAIGNIVYVQHQMKLILS